MFHYRRLVFLSLLLFTIHSVSGQSWVKEQRILDTNNSWWMGFSIDFDGSYLISDMNLNACIFSWQDTSWVQEALLFEPYERDTAQAVCLNKNWAAVGSRYKNKVNLFYNDGQDWVDSQIITGSDVNPGDQFGFTVDMNDQFIAVGSRFDDDSATNGGGVYIFQRNDLNWTEIQRLYPRKASLNNSFGFCIELFENYLIVGATDAAYIFFWDGLHWIEQSKINALTTSVAISNEYAVVGTTSGSLIYRRSGSSWNHQQVLEGTRQIYDESKKHISIHKDKLVINSEDSVVVYNLISNVWIVKQRVTPTDKYLANVIIFDNLLFISSPRDELAPWYDPIETPPSYGAIYFYQHKLPQEIDFPSIANKVYGATGFTSDATSSVGLPVSLTSDNEEIARIVNEEIEVVGAGTCKITASQQGDSIYLPAEPITRTLIIEKAPLQITADGKARLYGDSNPEFTFSCSGFVNGNDVNDLNILPGIACQASLISPTGEYPINLTGGVDDDYQYLLHEGALLINKAELEVLAENKTRLYGEANPAFTVKYSGFKNNENIDSIDTPAIATCGATIQSSTGDYVITASGGIDNNYGFAYTTGKLTINKASLTVTPTDKVKYYGDANPSLTCSYIGFKNDDTADDIDISPAFSCSADEFSEVGFYDIMLDGAQDNNYSFDYQIGKLLINKALLTVQAEYKSKNVGEPNPELTMTISGFRNNEAEGVIDELPQISCIANENSVVGSYPIVVSGGSDNNYQFIYVNGILQVIPLTAVVEQVNNSISFYPNPAIDKIYVNADTDEKDIIVKFSTLSGSVVFQTKYDGDAINIDGLAQGLYVVEIKDKRFILVKN